MPQPSKVNDDSLQVPLGLRWLWKLFYCHGFWVGFGTAVFLTPILMQLLSTAWTQHLPSWQEHFKSFIIGDPLLAIIVGLLALLTAKASTDSYDIPDRYWTYWFIAGLSGAALFILNDMRKGVLSLTQLLQPHLLYHHIFLITVFITFIGGMAYVQYRRHPRSRLWIAVAGLFLAYVSLVIFNTVAPSQAV